MGQTRFNATLVAGPTASAECVFPGMTATLPIDLTPNPKSWQVATGVLTRRVSVVAPAWLELDGIGSGHTVSEAHFIYIRSDAPILVRTTQGIVAASHTVQGIFLIEAPESAPIVLLEVQGSGTIEYFAQGQR